MRRHRKLQLADASCAGGDTAYNRVKPKTSGPAVVGAPSTALAAGTGQRT